VEGWPSEGRGGEAGEGENGAVLVALLRRNAGYATVRIFTLNGTKLPPPRTIEECSYLLTYLLTFCADVLLRNYSLTHIVRIRLTEEET